MYIQKALELSAVSFHAIDGENVPGDKKKADAAVPGKPAYAFYTAK